MRTRNAWISSVGLAGLTIAGCFSGSSTPVGVTGPDATADDAAVVEAGTDGTVAEAAGGNVSIDGSEPADAADATVPGNDAASGTEAGVDATGPADSATEAAVDATIDAGPVCDASTPGTHVLFDFDPTDPEFVSGVAWIDSTGTTTANWSAYGGPTHCTDPQEFFGQSYGAPEGSLPNPVVGGHLATLASASTCESTVNTITSTPADCTSTPQLPVTTTFSFYGAARADEVKISRTFGFDGSDAATPVYSGVGLRPYVPRVALAVFGTVIYPNQAGTAVTSVSASSCGGDCFTATGSTWSGQWFADIASSGYAMIVLRDPSMTSPVDLTVNWDEYSNSNLASFVLLQPVAGWQTAITEVEYLCFADLTTWPQSQRDAAVLPAGCGL
jgi:hypothetical protein